MSDINKGGYGWVLPESKSNNAVEMGKTSSRHMIMMLSFFHEGTENSQEHKELWAEMCDEGNNILDNIVVRERVGQEVVTVMQGHKSMDIVTSAKGFAKTLVKDSVSGKIGLLLLKGGNQIIGSRTMNVMELTPLDSVVSFIFKDGNSISIIDMQNGVNKYILTKEIPEEEKQEENIFEETDFTAKDVTEKDMEILSKEIGDIDEQYMHKIALKFGEDSEILAEKLYDDGYISERTKKVIKAVGLVVDIISE